MQQILRQNRSTAILVALVMLFVAACGNSNTSPTLAPSGTAITRPAAAFLTPQATPGPIVFPVDDGPHDDLTEWWYFTGHLKTAAGTDYGFEFVIFQGNRAGFPPAYASHFAITDVTSGTFHYDQRTQVGGQPTSNKVIDLVLGDWSLTGNGGNDTISANMPGFKLDLNVVSQKPPTLHGGDGYFEWAPATSSYYYSRTSMAATGNLTVDGVTQPVVGQAWMDHQWGNFLLFSGGWDWYSIQLDTGQAIMLWTSRDRQNAIIFGSGTWIDASGKSAQLGFQDFKILSTRSWTSPHSGAVYPSAWTVEIPSRNVSLTIVPVMQDQELDTRKSTGVIYWEGDVRITGTENGQPIAGQGYVELTGYAPVPTNP